MCNGTAGDAVRRPYTPINRFRAVGDRPCRSPSRPVTRHPPRYARNLLVVARRTPVPLSPHAQPCAGPQGLNERVALEARHRWVTAPAGCGSPAGAFLAMCAAISRNRSAVTIDCQP